MSRRGRAQRRHPALTIWAWAVFLFLVLPVLVVVPISFSSAQYLRFPPPGLSLRWYESYFSSAPWVEATVSSFRIGIVTAILATILGTLASFGLVRGRFPGKRALTAILQAPMIVPTIVVAVALYFAFARVQLVGNWLGVVLGHTALATPLVVINVSAALVAFDENLELAAANLGANRWRTFRYVTFPIVRPGVASGALFAFLVSFDELLVALFVAGLGAPTLPIKMWSSLQQDIDPTIAAISTLLVAVSCLVIFGGEAFRALAERRQRRPRTEAIDSAGTG